jgi:hypothetical protein
MPDDAPVMRIDFERKKAFDMAGILVKACQPR